MSVITLKKIVGTVCEENWKIYSGTSGQPIFPQLEALSIPSHINDDFFQAKSYKLKIYKSR